MTKENERQDKVDQKKSYESPAIVEYGSIVDLTQTAAGANTEVAGTIFAST